MYRVLSYVDVVCWCLLIVVCFAVVVGCLLSFVDVVGCRRLLLFVRFDCFCCLLCVVVVGRWMFVVVVFLFVVCCLLCVV